MEAAAEGFRLFCNLQKRLKTGGVIVLGELKTYIRQKKLFF